MFRVKRLFALVIVMGLFISVFTGCKKETVTSSVENSSKQTSEDQMIGNMYKTGLPLVKDKITLEAVYSAGSHLGDFNQMTFFINLEEKTNIHINFTMYDWNTYAEKIKLLLVSGEYPDMLFKMMPDDFALQYGEKGEIVQLDGLLEEWCPEWMKVFKEFPYAKSVITAPNGHIYSLPYIREDAVANSFRDVWYINKVFLDKLELKMPTTLEEYKNVLLAFKNGDPNGNGKTDEIPWTYRNEQYVGGNYDIFGCFGLLENDLHVAVKNGSLVFTPVQQENRDAVEYLSELYKLGLIDPEVFTQNTDQFKAKVAADPKIVGSYPDYDYAAATVDTISKKVFVPMTPLIAKAGVNPIINNQARDVERGYFTVFKTNKYLKETLRWVDELAKEENSVEAGLGLFGGVLKKVGDKYEKVAADANPNLSNPLNSIPLALTASRLAKYSYPITDVTRDYWYANIYKKYTVPVYEVYPRKGAWFTVDDSKTMQTLGLTELYQYVKNTRAKWIMNGFTEAEWTAFVTKCEQMNYKQITAIYQKYYEGFKK